jgi:selenocysteine lyase/cysteine desulfurase
MDVRDAFDLPDDVVYLNTAFMGAVPIVALEAGLVGLARKSRPWTIAPDDFSVPLDQLRGAFAHLLGVPHDAEGVAITPAVSYGVSTAAHNLTLAPGQVIVIQRKQFPSDVYGWEDLADRHDGRLHQVAEPSDGDWTAAILADLESLGDQVGIVSVPPLHWSDGTVVDLEAIGEAARSVGAAFCIDTCQWLGAAPFDVARLLPDFVFGATYKWLCGPYSMGFLWAAPHRRDGHPIEHSWTTRANSHCLACLADYTEEYQTGARRYDVGEPANFALVPVALASAELIADWGPEHIAAHNRLLTDRIAQGAEALGLGVAAAHLRSPHIVGLHLDPALDTESVAPLLADRGIHVSVRGTAIRVSPHVYNTLDEVDRFLEGLEQVLGSLSPRA